MIIVKAKEEVVLISEDSIEYITHVKSNNTVYVHFIKAPVGGKKITDVEDISYKQGLPINWHNPSGECDQQLVKIDALNLELLETKDKLSAYAETVSELKKQLMNQRECLFYAVNHWGLKRTIYDDAIHECAEYLENCAKEIENNLEQTFGVLNKSLNNKTN